MLSGLVVALILTPCTIHAANIYDLAADWSDTANPNGPWSYNAAPGLPLTNHIADFDPTRSVFVSAQPAWAYTTWPNFEHIPHFLKIVSNSVDPRDDLPIGRVEVHDNDPSNSPSGLGDLPAGISWTSPTAGQIVISGDMWEVQRYLGRTQDWTLSVNGVAISGGVLDYSSTVTSLTPLSLASGSGGAVALTRAVSAGDVVSLDWVRAPDNPYGTNMGVDLSISLTPLPEPSTIALAMLGIFALLVYRRRR
jgi:hypothetical protein